MKTITLHLHGITPADLSMKRLALYLAELNELYGADAAVHFDSVTTGSAKLNANIENDSYSHVVNLVRDLSQGKGGRKGLAAYKKLGELISQDNANGAIEVDGYQIVKFPHLVEQKRTFTIKKHGSVQGKLYQIGGKDNRKLVRIQGADKETLFCTATQEITEKLAPYLFKNIRVTGYSIWDRQEEGGWKMKSLEIESYTPLDSGKLSDAIQRLRNTGGIMWNEMDSPHSTILDGRG
ncbi:hypothetical protein [Cobetia crustatorum]|uniref:Uncharacterized protein n=1 Tax=Cobetia crustatorum TaxID=553385 RepID=A0A558HG93_9GAMM|nr:hypothetical protein [Cobetia crustatorum]TVU68088.1 hypothetical protein FQP86_14955 [Cobetia crustatorum]